MLIYDSTNPFDIPTRVEAVAGYVNGLYAWSEAGWTRFPNAQLIGISVAAVDAGDALDVETFDATPAEVPGWVKLRRAAGIAQPWVYVNRANRPAVETALQAAGIQPDQVALWVATLDGTLTVPPGPYPVVAVQYQAATAGGHYDISQTTLAFTGAPGHLSSGGFGTMTDDEINRQFNFLNAEVAKYADAIGALETTMNSKLDQLLAKPSSSSPEAPEPAEPKTLSLTIPAQTLTGTLS